MRKNYIFCFPEHEVRRGLCGSGSFDAAEQRDCGDYGRPEGWLALSGHRIILQRPPADQSTKTDHRLKVSLTCCTPRSPVMKEIIVRTTTSSVVTSVTIVESRNYISSKDNNKNRVPVPKRPDKTPRFEFYLYNDEGRIIKQYLTIHEIQQILLQQSQNLGWFKF